MNYDLMGCKVSGSRPEMWIRTYPFLWLAKLMARPAWWWPGEACMFSITRGRHDIIWRRKFAQAGVTEGGDGEAGSVAKP